MQRKNNQQKSEPSPRQQNLYEVQSIQGHRFTTKGQEFYVKWKSYPPQQNTWEPISNLQNVQDLIKQYKKHKKDIITKVPHQIQQQKHEELLPNQEEYIILSSNIEPESSHNLRTRTRNRESSRAKSKKQSKMEPEKIVKKKKSQPSLPIKKKVEHENNPKRKNQEQKNRKSQPQNYVDKKKSKKEDFVLEESSDEIGVMKQKRGKKKKIKDELGQPVPVPVSQQKPQKPSVTLKSELFSQPKPSTTPKSELFSQPKSTTLQQALASQRKSQTNLPAKWYQQSPYTLGQIFTHYIQDNQIIYGVQVTNTHGQLLCTTEIDAFSLQQIDYKKVKDYMMNIVKDALYEESRRKYFETQWNKDIS